ncbi:MAG: 4Fe-4S dicluster domain-containing protein [Deltaproteobacteria bacterium]|nr:4Fe-4S dicluster domain-containing protein [Deltaproteobacteria bacterium]
MTRILKKEDLERLIVDVINNGSRFIAPKRQARQVVYLPIDSPDELEMDYIAPRNSFKEYLFPQTEVIATFSTNRDGVDMASAAIVPKETVIFGARPCDAASVASLRVVFTWDFIDEFYTKREDSSIVITIACTKADEACFCATVGVSPEDKRGSDILLKETESGDYLVEHITDKGSVFVERYKKYFTPADTVMTKKIVEIAPIEGIDLERIFVWLKDTANYNSPLWSQEAMKCIGCGACTYSCPTCHCFDITDEGTSSESERRKNWDSCQYDNFTLHASGHNPRDTQPKKWRNRFMCKFNFYPEKFSSKGCVGCGRCIRVCPVRLDITEVMSAITDNE